MLSAPLFALLAALPALSAPTTSSNGLHKRFTSVRIKSFRTGECLSTVGGREGIANVTDGTRVQTIDCRHATRWDINPGSGSVLLTGTKFALDAGVNPSNNVPAKVWTSYPGLTQQTWFLTGDNRIAITGGTQCLDQGDASVGTQTYQCTTGNTNQIWNVLNDDPPAAPVVQLKWAKDGQNQCATVIPGRAYDGAPVALADCQAPIGTVGPNVGSQLWATLPNGQIQLNGTNFCLDAGVNPANGAGMKTWTCYSGLLQQTWRIDSGTKLVSLANNQCLDVKLESVPRVGTPFNTTADLQTWQCSATDPQQLFIAL